MQHRSESEEGGTHSQIPPQGENVPLQTVCSVSAKPPLDPVLTDSQSGFLSLPQRCKKCLQRPLTQPPQPPLTHPERLKKSTPVGLPATVRLWLAFSWGSCSIREQQEWKANRHLCCVPPPTPQLVASIVFISFGVIAAFCCAIVDGVFAARHIVSTFNPGSEEACHRARLH